MNNIINTAHSIQKLTIENSGIIPFHLQPSLEVLKGKWPEIMSHMVQENHIDSLSYSMYLKPIKPESVDDVNPSCWKIVAKMEDFDKNLDTYVNLKYSAAIRNSIKDVLGVECTFKLYSEGCKGSARMRSVGRALSRLFSNRRKPEEPRGMDLLESMALFKIDNLNNIDKESLKHQRNKLLKIYHPDESGLESLFAEKINHSYRILLDYAK